MRTLAALHCTLTAGPIAVLLAFATACAGTASTDSLGDTSDTDDTGDTGDTGDDGPVGFADLPPGTWSLLPVDGMMCADGSSTGIGVNPGTSNEIVLVLYMQHACYLDTFCAPGWLDRLHTQGYDDGHLRSTAAALGRLTLLDRDDASSPLRDATWIYVPECSGDLYAGDNVESITGGEPDKVLHFRGDRNVLAAINRVTPEFPAPDRVWGLGVSMGGFGIQLQADRIANAWPGADRAFLADSAPMIPLGSNQARTMMSVWDLRFPDGCAGCETLFQAALEHQLTAQPDARFGLIAFADDEAVQSQVLRGLTGEYPTKVASLLDELYTGPQAAAFLVDAEGHLGLRSSATAQSSGGATLDAWLRAWASGTEGFRTER